MKSSSWKSQLGVRCQTDGLDGSKRNAVPGTGQAGLAELIVPTRVKIAPVYWIRSDCHADHVAAGQHSPGRTVEKKTRCEVESSGRMTWA
jgi:hypothetical protein